MSRTTLINKINEIRNDLILQIADYQSDINESHEISWYTVLTEDILADAVDNAFQGNISQTEWYQENISEISDEEIVECLRKDGLCIEDVWYTSEKVTIKINMDC